MTDSLSRRDWLKTVGAAGAAGAALAAIPEMHVRDVHAPGDIVDLSSTSDVFIPQDNDYPALRLDIDRERSATLGLDQREVVNNVITALTSNAMIAPSCRPVIVMTGTSVFFSAWPKLTARSVRPRARANLM